MVAGVSGSTIIMVSAAVSLFAAGVILETADTFNADTITNMSMHAWDRFGDSDSVWVEVTMTHPGGPLDISGDIVLCFVPPEGAARCEATNKTAVWRCDVPSNNNTRHDCLSVVLCSKIQYFQILFVLSMMPEARHSRHGGRQDRTGQGAARTPLDEDLRAAKPR